MIEFDVLQFNSEPSFNSNKIRCTMTVEMNKKYIPEIFEKSTAGKLVSAKTNQSARKVDESVLKVVKDIQKQIKQIRMVNHA